MADQIKIMIKYSMTVDDRTFLDTIILDEAEYRSMSQEQIDAIKQKRFDAWAAVLDAPVSGE